MIFTRYTKALPNIPSWCLMVLYCYCLQSNFNYIEYFDDGLCKKKEKKKNSCSWIYYEGSKIISERPFWVLLTEKYGAVVPMTFRRIMQTTPRTSVHASLSLIIPLCYLMHDFRRWKETRQHQNTNSKVFDNEKGGRRHNKDCLGLQRIAQPKGREGMRERKR